MARPSQAVHSRSFAAAITILSLRSIGRPEVTVASLVVTPAIIAFYVRRQPRCCRPISYLALFHRVLSHRIFVQQHRPRQPAPQQVPTAPEALRNRPDPRPPRAVSIFSCLDEHRSDQCLTVFHAVLDSTHLYSLPSRSFAQVRQLLNR